MLRAQPGSSGQGSQAPRKEPGEARFPIGFETCHISLLRLTPQRTTGWVSSTTEFYCLTVLKAASLRSRYQQGWFHSESSLLGS